MSISLTRILQQITGLNTFFQGPNAGRQNGVVLEDSATVTWTTDGQGNIQATAAGGSAPSGAANEVYATPNGSSGSASLRSLVAADIPVLTNANLPAGTMQLIQKQTVSGTPTTVMFSAIPQTFTNLRLVGSFQENGGGSNLDIQFNGDTAAHYSYVVGFVSGTTAEGLTATGATSSLVGIGTAGSIIIDIPNYSQSVLANTYFSSQGATDAGMVTGSWAGNAANSIKLFDSAGATFTAGSTFSLYGY